MGEIVLIRHGQANSAAQDEASYDLLSDLGHQQARWLGAWIRDHEGGFDATYIGSLRRHRETALSMGIAHEHLRVDPRFDELGYFSMALAMQNSHGVPLPQSDREFFDHIPQLMNAWHRAEIDADESFVEFELRVTQAVIDVAREGRRVMVVTSGGVIGMIFRHLLDLDPGRMAHILVPIMNTSLHRIQVVGSRMILSGFNATPHLDAPDRMNSRTTY
ncbi:MAG: histidine phosphatase family protein [Pseudomonadota bacterium]